MSYCSVDDLRDEGFEKCDFSDRRAQRALDFAQAFFEDQTGRFFEPRNRAYNLTWRGAPDMLMEAEIIRIDSLQFVNTDGTLSTPLGVEDFIVFNRHVREGLLAPDDRESPKIAFQFLRPGLITPRTEPRLVQDLLSRRVQEVRLTGRFGYTEPDPNVGRAIASAAGDAITVPDLIAMDDGAFTESDVAARITVAGAANAANNATFEITERISATQVRIVEQTLVTEGTGFTATIAEFPQSGRTPLEVQRACLLIASKRLGKIAQEDPIDDAISGGRIQKLQVRDQSITLQPDIRVSRGDAAFTGDPEIDQIIVRYIRPARVVAV